jgi:hypothetical protein
VAEGGTAGRMPLALQFIDGVNDVAQQVEAIGDLNRGRRSQTHSLSDAVTAVAGDDLGAGVPA